MRFSCWTLIVDQRRKQTLVWGGGEVHQRCGHLW